MASADLMTEEQSLFVDGIGYLDQYGSYVDTFWEKGVVYFVRDYFFNEVQRLLHSGAEAKDLRPLVYRLNTLNSEIEKWEQNGRPSHYAIFLGRSSGR